MDLRTVSVASALLLGGCGQDSRPASSPSRLGPFSAWSDPVNLGPVVNTAANESGPSVSDEGRSLYFQSNRPGGFGRTDMYVSQRATVTDPWGPPRNLGPIVNSAGPFFNGMPDQSPDGRALYFCSDGPGGFGGLDLWVSRRDDIRDDLGWRAPVNLGPNVNSRSDECDPALLLDPRTGSVTLYFAGFNRPGGTGDWDLFQSTQLADGSFSPALPVAELNTATRETGPTWRRDGLEILFTFSSGTGEPSTQLLSLVSATRESTGAALSPRADLPGTINAPGVNTRAPELSADGTTLYFVTGRAGGSGGGDIWVSTRTPR